VVGVRGAGDSDGEEKVGERNENDSLSQFIQNISIFFKEIISKIEVSIFFSDTRQLF
jgi:hypothetical protein